MNNYSDYSLIPIVLASILFELFRRLKIKASICINFISEAALMVYLIHDHSSMHQYWQYKEDLTWLLSRSPVQFLLKIVLRAVLTYALGTAVYVAYKLLGLALKKCSHPTSL